MQKILAASAIRELDAYTISHEPIASIDLMERACRAFVHWFSSGFDATNTVGIVCGTGNNGGDGAGIARLLSEWDYPVRVWVVRGGAPESPDFKINIGRLGNKVQLTEITPACDRSIFDGCDVIIDAIFGSGLSRPPEGIYRQVIECINSTNARVVSVDIPSGLMTDAPSTGPVVEADHTVTFQLPKLAFFLPQSYKYTGEWVVVDIGLSRDFIKKSPSDFGFLQRKDVAKIIRPRSKFDHKGTFGHVILVSGSYGKMGAAILAARAAQRTGAGLVTVHAPSSANLILQTAVPEAMFSADTDSECFSEAPSPDRYSALGVGPGLGTATRTVQAFGTLLEKFRRPMVIDADALNMLSANRHLIDRIPPGSILTPHPKEFERLVGQWSDDFDRLRKQRELAAQLKCVVLVKGAYTAIATPGGFTYFNSTGNPGMATGGTGDVLTGILTALLAQSYAPEDAAVAGVYLHGLAGDLASVDKGMHSLIASDVIDFLPSAWKKVARG